MATNTAKPDHDTDEVEFVRHSRHDRALPMSTLDMEDDPHRAALEDNPAQAERPSWSTMLAVLFLSLSFGPSIPIGTGMVASAIVPIAIDLDGLDMSTWILGAIATASSVAFAVAGRLSDVFGRRYIILLGNFLCIIGSIVGATAKSVPSVIVAQTLLGLGLGNIFVAYAGIAELLPNKWRGLGLGLTEFFMQIPFGVCCVLIGNVLAYKVTWRWIYYIAIIYSVICFLGVATFYFPPKRPQADFEKSRWQEVKEIDYLGLFMYTGGLSTLLIGITWAGTAGHPWKSASVIAPLVIGVVVFLVCFVYDFTVPKKPFFPFHLFRQVREFTILLWLVFVSGAVYISMTALLPQAALYMFSHDPVQIGIISIPGGVSQIIGGFVVPAMVHRIRYIKWQLVAAVAIQTVFTACYAAVVPQNRGGFMALQFWALLSFPMITVLAYLVAGLHVPQRDLGVASGLIGTFRSAGGSVGNAIFATILNSFLSKRLVSSIIEAALKAGYPPQDVQRLIPVVIATGSGVSHQFQTLNPPASAAVQAATAEAFKQSYAFAFRRMFLCTIPFGVLAIIAAIFINDPSHYLTNHVAVHMEKEILGPSNKENVGDGAMEKNNSETQEEDKGISKT